MSNIFDVLVDDWRSIVLIDSGGTSDDGVFHIEEIDEDGRIEEAYHEVDRDRVEVYGQAIIAGSLISVVMEHLAINSTTQIKRYIASLVVDEPHRSIIIGKKGTYDIDEAREVKKAGKRKAKNMRQQDDGTVIITKP